jgi:hypothetical protein
MTGKCKVSYLVKLSFRMSILLIAMLILVSAFGISTYSTVSAQPPPIQINDIMVPNEVAQDENGQVQATIINPQNQSFNGFAKFYDNFDEISSYNPSNPYESKVNFTIGPESELDLILPYTVAYNATIGLHIVTFEIDIGGFSFLFNQYEITVVPVATITSIVPGQVFTQSQVGILLVYIENHVDHPVNVSLDVFGSKFVNASEEVELSPGQNNIVIPILNNATHVYDFGISAVNVSMYYNDELISSQVILVPVDMTLVNKVLAVILPACIFLILVLVYAFRKRRRVRRAVTSE